MSMMSHHGELRVQRLDGQAVLRRLNMQINNIMVEKASPNAAAREVQQTYQENKSGKYGAMNKREHTSETLKAMEKDVAIRVCVCTKKMHT